jgi:filamentous hemagglutinin family protein
VASAAGPTGVKLDGTLGGSAVALTGPVYNITQSLGKLSGGNLFFSFQYFSIATGNTALFTTTSSGIGNVISRVTGGYASSIDGTISLQAASGAPNFFLINPNGVSFTANAVIDVPAAVYVTTANYVKFSDGNFYADPAKTSTLSTAAPEAFGFLGSTRTAVDISGATLFGSGQDPIAVVAGDVTIEDGGALSGGFGDVRIIATGSQAVEVPLTGRFLSNEGTITLQNGGGAVTFGDSLSPAGGIYLSAGSLDIDGLAAGYAGLTSFSGGAGAGPIGVDVAGPLRLANGGSITAYPFGGPGAPIRVNAGALTIEGPSTASQTGVFSFGSPITVSAGSLAIDASGTGAGAYDVGIGNVVGAAAQGLNPDVDVTVNGSARLTDGGLILTNTSGSAAAGAITLTAGSLFIDGGPTDTFTGVSSYAETGSSGNAGRISITTSGASSLSAGAQIRSSTSGSGDAGTVTLNAGSLSIENSGAAAHTGIASVTDQGASGNAADVVVNSAGAITLSSGGAIVSTTEGAGNAANVTVTAGSLQIDGGSSTLHTGISSGTDQGSSGNAANVLVTSAGAINISSGGEIDSSSQGAGNAGNVTVSAHSLQVDGSGPSTYITGITSNAPAGFSGRAGDVSVSIAAATVLTDGGVIISTTPGTGDAGTVTVGTGSLQIDGGSSSSHTGISSGAEKGATGNANNVVVNSPGAITISSGGEIDSSTQGPGHAGKVTVSADSLQIDGSGASMYITGITTNAEAGSAGRAGDVSVTTAGATTLTNGGDILSSTSGAGNAGDVTVNAGALQIDGGSSTLLTGISSSTDTGSQGNAGQVSVSIAGPATLSSGGQILSATFSSGHGGTVMLASGSLSIVGSPAAASTGIFSGAHSGSTGAAGAVSVDVAGTASLANGGQINSEAQAGSAGQPGTITLRAGALQLGSGGAISIGDDATVADPAHIFATQIHITAGNIQMSGGEILASSTGNIGASDITVRYGQLLYMDPSAISTSSFQGNGGPITISGQGPLWIEDSNITTSVLGKTNGNGGDISIDVPYIVLSSGAIQANTLAPRASGGEVTIDAQALIPSYASYVLGGSSVTFDPTIAGLNVVQAAAPNGVSGILNVTVPTLDLGTSLLGLTGAPATPTALGRSLCSYRQGSSLSMAGRGGLPISARDPLWVESEDDASDAPTHAAIPTHGDAPTQRDAPSHGDAPSQGDAPSHGDAPTHAAVPPYAGQPGERPTAIAVIACR